MEGALLKAWEDYKSQFGDAFPTMEVVPRDDAQLLDYLNKCLGRNEPAKKVFNLVYDDGRKY